MARHLAIEANTDSICFYELVNGRIRQSHDAIIAGNSPEAKRKSLDEIIQSIDLLKEEFDDYSLGWSSGRSTLVPSNVFSDSTPESLFKLCFGEPTKDQDVDYNRISELSAVNLYEIPTWVKSAFVIRFPRILIQHTGSHVIRAVMDKEAFYLKATVILFDKFFLLTLAKHNKLEFYSFFDYSTVEDVIYHISFALQQKELEKEKGKLEIVSGIQAVKSLAQEIADMSRKIDIFAEMEPSLNTYFIAKSQELCV